nr:hypothetical protein [Candidatus Undinarchaeales archaeon ERR594346 U_76725]
MRKAQGGLPFGASLIIAIVLSLIGAAFIFNMGGQIFGVKDAFQFEGLELVALGNPGNLMVVGYGDGDAKLFFGPEVGNEFPNVFGNGRNPWVQVRVGDLDGDGIDDDFVALTEDKELVIFNIKDYTEQYEQLNDYTTSNLAGLTNWDVISLEEEVPSDSNMIEGAGDSLGDLRAFRKDDGEIIIGNKPLLVGDLDGDGDDEIIVLGVSVFHIYRQTDSGGYEEYSVEYYDAWESDANTVSFAGGVEVAGISDSDLDGRENNIVLIYRSTTNEEKSPRKMRTLEIEFFQLESGWLAGVYATGAVVSSAEDLGSISSGFSRYYTGASICDFDGDGIKNDLITLRQDLWGAFGWQAECSSGCFASSDSCRVTDTFNLATLKPVMKVCTTSGNCIFSLVDLEDDRTFSNNFNWLDSNLDTYTISHEDWPIDCGDWEYSEGYIGIPAMETVSSFDMNSQRRDSVEIYINNSISSKTIRNIPKIALNITSSDNNGCPTISSMSRAYHLTSCPTHWKQDWLDIACGDLDNDGKAEIALLAEPSHIYIAEIDALSLTSAEATAFTSHTSIINTLPWAWIGLPEKRWTSLEVANVVGRNPEQNGN